MEPADALRADIGQAKVVVRSLRNHARNVVAYLTDLEERLDASLERLEPPAQEAQGQHELNGNAHIEARR